MVIKRLQVVNEGSNNQTYHSIESTAIMITM